MKKLVATVLLTLILLTSTISAEAAQRVKGYTKKNGTYVKPYMRSNKNSSALDNYSTKGNINPYTGKKGTKKLKK